MLKGCVRSFNENKIDFIFISTHDNNHKKCLDFLINRWKFKIIAEHSISESFSADGLIVCSAPHVKENFTVKISKRKNLFDFIKNKLSLFYGK